MLTLVGTLLHGLGVGSGYALIALGFSLVLRSSGVIDFARGSLVVVATLTTTWLMGEHMVTPVAVLAVCLVVGSAIAVAEERIAVFPLRGDARGSGWLVTTLGFGIIVQAFASRLFGAGTRGVAPPYSVRDFHVGDVVVTGYELTVALIAVAVTALTWVAVQRTGAGRWLRAVAEDPECAALRGINTRLVALAVFALAGAIAGLAGFAIVPLTQATAAQAPLFTIKGFIAMVLGGTGSIWGALIGGLLLGCAEQVGAHYLSGDSTDLFGLAVLLAVLLIRPQGLFASRQLRTA